jgi:acetyl-CoA carboxylase biotin carboxyl carrier protein
MTKKKGDVPPNSEHEMIRALAALLKETDLTEIELERAGLRVRVSRAGGIAAFAPAAVSAPSQAAPAAAGPVDISKHPGAVHSPMVGTVYVAPAPGSQPFVKVGDSVAEGQTLLIVEAMKTMNPIAAPRSGKITQILISDGQPVEFGETLMVIE